MEKAVMEQKEATEKQHTNIQTLQDQSKHMAMGEEYHKFKVLRASKTMIELQLNTPWKDNYFQNHPT
eukprot:9214056-Ditylum_brightwellii.AAC.1